MKLKVVAAHLLAMLAITSCAGPTYRSDVNVSGDGLYDTHFPANAAKSLEHIIKATKKVYSQAQYKVHKFEAGRKLLHRDITRELMKNPDTVEYMQTSVVGTGTVILNTQRRLALISCSHVFEKPDTLFSYYNTKSSEEPDYIASIAIKERQDNFVNDIPGVRHLDILAIDEEADIAILGKKFLTDGPPIPYLYYPFGQAKELQWGTLVYIVGFPGGFHQITTGLVSEPNRDGKGGFLLDSNFNKGFSGGIVLALRDGVPNFEIVGIATSTSGEDRTVLVPNDDREYIEGEIYMEAPYIGVQSNIKYGITFATSSERIMDLLRRKQYDLKREGYDFSGLLR
jgi:hypothetical protein